jgi:hypothetical protein
MLHITNGDSAADLLRATGITGTVIAWRDVLHEGPVPTGLTLEAMSDVRARFLAACDWGKFEEIRRSFNARDDALRGARHVVLWFEHDLYDQLQLLQILAALANQPETKAELINIGSFPGVEPFHGLGQLTPVQMASLWPQRIRVAGRHTALAARAWKAFCSPDRLALPNVLAGDTSALPFLRAALQRHLEEFPTAPDGLGRTDRQILRAVAEEQQRFEDVFRANQAAEAAPFMGDATFRLHLDALTHARHPLLTREPITLTPTGRRVLAGELDARSLNGIDRWFGGVHLKANS